MYYVKKRMEIAGAHFLKLPYQSKCQNIHGHNWIVTVYCKAPVLTDYGMIVDFTQIKQAVSDKLDHKFLNELFLDMNPTAENMAKWVCDTVNNLCEVGCCYRVDIQESEGNVATYERED